jgi:putative DNA primase/helicase
MTGRYLYANPITFEPTHKLVLQTNAVPSLDHLDAAIRGRLHLVPFDRRWNRPGEPDANPLLPDGNEHLVDDLRDEGPGVLNWIIRGAVRYAKEKLTPPAEVVNMTRSYFEDQDWFGRWLARYERCDPTKGRDHGEGAARIVS